MTWVDALGLLCQLPGALVLSLWIGMLVSASGRDPDPDPPDSD